MAAGGGLGGAPGWVKLALVASVCINLALIGLLSGAVIGSTDDDQRRKTPFLLRLLPESRHDEARALMAEQAASRSDLDGMRAEYEQTVLKAMTADPFEPAALSAALGSMNELTLKRRSATQAQLVEIAGRMTPEERQAMAERMTGMFARWAERRKARREAAAEMPQAN